MVYGSKAPWSKVTEAEVLAIRKSDDPYNLGRSLGIDKGTVYAILIRKTWKHLSDSGTTWRVMRRTDRRGTHHSSKL